MHLRSLEVYSHHLRKFLHPDLRLFEVSVWIQTFAQAMISVFVPIILWQLGYSVKEVIAFYVIFHVIDVPLNLLAKKLIQRSGARIVVMFSIFAELFYFILLYNLHRSWFELGLLAIFLAIFDSFYWVAHLYIFVQSSHNRGSRLRNDISILNIIRVVGGFFAPAIGAFILIKSDSHTLIFASTLLMFASLLPLFRMRHLKFKPEEGSATAREFFRSSTEKINFFLDALSVFRYDMENIIWPFYIFLVYDNIRTVAFIPILISLGTLAVTYFAARLSVRNNIYRLVAYGSFTTALIWIFRIFFLGHEFVLIASVLLISLLAILVDVPLEVAIFERGKQTDILNSVTYLNLVRMSAGAMFFIALLFMNDVFRGSFYLISVLLIILGILSYIASKYRAHLLVYHPEPIELEVDKDAIP